MNTPLFPKPTHDTWPTGFTVNPRVSALSADLIEAYRTVPVPHASDSMGRHIGARGLSAYHRDQTATMAGPAITVRIRPGDNLMVHLAMMMAEPGDIIVIDGGGDLSTAVIGGLMRTTAIARRLGGFVIDGALRDVADWKQGGMPAYAKGNVHRGPSNDGPGEVNVPIACAGLQVTPGDLILADADGVVAIPAHQADSLLIKCRAHAAREQLINEKNMTGELDCERFNELLRMKGCPQWVK
ncbi:RraA family protein [Brucella cytisi]|uniref:Putative 4-hydroxy-4-methyl-2-oxoglutarate aldolase n=1 Tax=Brucella cytisi TaxID=407152 RepID=A0A1J6I5S2_9HYPH|nr:RraA family protein [Brucella cytisi]OIS90280.1 methyltransferase [Brucella cytisi]